MKSHAVTWGNVLRRSAAASVAWYRSPRRRSAAHRSPRAVTRQILVTPGSGPKPLIGTQPLPRSVTCATTPRHRRALARAITSTSLGPTSPEARSARTTQIFVAGQSRFESGSVVDLGPLGVGQSARSVGGFVQLPPVPAGRDWSTSTPVPLAPGNLHFASPRRAVEQHSRVWNMQPLPVNSGIFGSPRVSTPCRRCGAMCARWWGWHHLARGFSWRELVAPPGCAMSLCNSPSETGAAAVASTLIEATAAGHCRGSAAVSWLAS